MTRAGLDAALPDGILSPAVVGVLGDDGAALGVRALTHNAGNQATGGIWRVQGPAGRAVVKLATADGGGDRAWATSDHGHHWNYWRREVLAYRSGFAHSVYADAGLGAPGMLAVVEPRPGVVALWLEDVAGLPGAGWPVARLADFAERLGRAQAGWAGRPPPHPWLSRRWLRQYVASKPITEPVAWDHPRAAAVWPAEVRAGLQRLWERRAELLALAEALPQTTCHLDVWPMNLIARGGAGQEIVLVDWAFAGAGAVGEDIGNLIPDSVADGLIEPALLPEISEAVTGGYLAGLRAGGWRGRDAEVRRAIAVTGAAKYCWLAPRMLQGLADGGRRGFYDRRGDGQVLAGRLGMLALVASWGRLALG
jgi:Phosphotransferase enzyme family